MADPELQGDEEILLRTQGVHVKSISFEAILTNKRIILVDRLKNLLPPKEIPIATIQSIEPGENAIRDLTLSMGVITKTGGVRQMVLTFSREGGGNRAEERDEWIRQIRAYLTPSFEQVMRKVIPGIESPGAGQALKGRRPVPSPADNSRIPLTVRPDSPEQWNTTPQPEPAAESILGTYCTHCGTKVPEGSGFCNKCGAQITPAREIPPVPVSPPPPAMQPGAVPRPAQPQYREAPPGPEYDPEASPRAPPAPLPPRRTVPVPPAQANPAPQYTDERKRQSPRLFSPKDMQPTPLVPSSMSTAVPPPLKKPRNTKKIFLAAGIIVIILIIAVAGVVVLPKLGILSFHSSGSASTSSTTQTTPAIATTTTAAASASSAGTGTAVVVATATPADIPSTGVAVSVSYIGGFKGSYTANGNTTSISNSGNKVYEIDNVTGPVSATFQKTDDTVTHALTVGIYNNGAKLVSNSTSASYGTVTVTTSV
ncbi:hypothetical protein Mboo_0823 [Methanoregula boonei 6A8]|uniref:Zinc-ribbon domain-containing protein n=1 Tax=Methanoregula boonei (strain DSM 21154 / JCM 14090 / 6A8) TaxID=456442 RepID=A7I6I0_METB6|nr:zinc ribbon domain-containing protein [Methanoregula boonei]ABS55341.1 hypothetical protein Mboo_0823 [Methanoregula boonei 6A8]